MGGALIDIVQQGRQDIFWVRNVDKLVQSTRVMDALTRQVLESMNLGLANSSFCSVACGQIITKSPFRKGVRSAARRKMGDVDLSTPLELNVTTIRALRNYTPRKVSID